MLGELSADATREEERAVEAGWPGGREASAAPCGERVEDPKAKWASRGRWSDGKREEGRQRSRRTVSSVGSCSTCKGM